MNSYRHTLIHNRKHLQVYIQTYIQSNIQLSSTMEGNSLGADCLGSGEVD